MSTDPNAFDTVLLAHLEGQEEVFTDTHLSFEITVREADFHNLGRSLDRLHALVHMFEAAHLLDHNFITDANRSDFQAAMEAILMITDEARSARAHFNAASGSL